MIPQFSPWLRRRAERRDAASVGRHCRRLAAEAAHFSNMAALFRAMEREALPIRQRTAEEHADLRAGAEREAARLMAEHDHLYARWAGREGFNDGYDAEERSAA